MPITNRPQYYRYLEEAKRAELAEQLQADGYHIELDSRSGDLRYDLVAKKGAEKIAFQVKSRDALRDSKKQIEQLTSAAKKLGYDFRLVIVTPPKEPSIEIQGFKEILLDYLQNNDFPQELYDIASQPSIDSVVDVEIDILHVRKDDIQVAGSGTLEVTLVYGGGGEDGMTTQDEYPFEFEVILNHELEISRVESLSVDVSSFYE